MKKVIYYAAAALLIACTPVENNQPTVVETEGIALSEHDITIEKGANKVLEVKFSPENATNKAVTWVSSNTSIATVADGIIVGIAPGTTEIVAKCGNLIDRCAVTVVVYAISLTLDETELTLPLGETVTLTATVLPDDASDEVEWFSSDESVATVQDGVVSAVSVGNAKITAKAGNCSADCAVNVIPAGAVDMGIIMTREDGSTYNLYWAECNLGAEKPEDYGDYYAWGEIETKSDYSWSNYKFGTSEYDLSKYNTLDSNGAVDNKTELEADDDVAHVKLGGEWRLPTIIEVEELISTRDNSSYQWEWKSLNGHNGWMVTYLVNNNSIFLPAAGRRYGTSLDFVGSSGRYWSSSLRTYKPNNACELDLNSDEVRESSTGRYYGCSVRPVSE